MSVKSLLLLINFINDYIEDRGALNQCIEEVHAKHIISRANQAINWCRSHQIPIVHMRTAFHDNYIDLPLHSPLFKVVKQREALKMNTWGSEIHEDIFKDESDTILTKHRISSFYGTELEQILSTHSINTLLIAGVSTSDDVELTAREAHDRDYYSIILEDICADRTNANHLLALENMERFTKVRKIADLEK
ncbi:MAG: cysteine hydrolase [Rhabdochlamydiaceae bacterium]|nr:cysteine hydrolase [Candidatus Amphrikana amoebophyrae]